MRNEVEILSFFVTFRKSCNKERDYKNYFMNLNIVTLNTRGKHRGQIQAIKKH